MHALDRQWAGTQAAAIRRDGAGGQDWWAKDAHLGWNHVSSVLLPTEWPVEFWCVSSRVTVDMNKIFSLSQKHQGFLWDVSLKELLEPKLHSLQDWRISGNEVHHGCGLFSALNKGKICMQFGAMFFLDYERVKKKHICNTEAERPCRDHSGLCQQFFLPLHTASNGKVLPALCKLLISSCYQILLIKRQVGSVLTVWGKMNNCWCPLNSV